MFPKIPDALAELSPAALRSLAAEIKTHATEVLAGSPTAEEVAEVRAYAGHRNALLAEARRQEAASAAAGEFDEEPEAPQVEINVEDAGSEPEPDDDDDDEADDAPEVTAAVRRSPRHPAVRTTTGVASAPDTQTPTRRITPTTLLARDGVSGKRAGEGFESWAELSVALAEKSSTIRSNSSERFGVGYIPGTFAADRVLSENPVFNLSLFEEEEIEAAMCAPLEPQYDLSCWNTNRRPVRNSLAGYLAPRGGVTIYPSPSLSDITAGIGQWTPAMDANPAAVKEACQTIACATPQEYRIYGIYRCLTVKNLLAMTFPELVEAYLNRLAAAQARLAETLLLEAMATGADTLMAHTLGYNATVSITTNILNYLALYQEQQRWDQVEMDAWMPRWVLFALKADAMRRRSTSGRISCPSDSEIASLFTDAGVTPHFYLDTPSWATRIPAFQVSGALGWFPRNLEILVAPRGKFAVMDRGELAIGVTGNNLYRDNVSNSRNEFTLFFENFEGVVNTNSCPAHILHLDNLCFNGQQIADVVLGCEGANQVGAAS